MINVVQIMDFKLLLVFDILQFLLAKLTPESRKLSQLDNKKPFDEEHSWSVVCSMAASTRKVIAGMAPKFRCSERARKQGFCTKLEQKHKGLEEERSSFEGAFS
ncbi:hypothetical protein WN944_027344 [Citrus x changshan-huyou]|uniref:Uncharacterized protein n=1 Tax=Citrus x changshan-huyou TaxID=2935761 RepID=A0AAP0Q941_9ROSI